MPKVPVKYDTNINIRVDSDMILELKKIANENNIKYNTMIRNILNDFIFLYNHSKDSNISESEKEKE